MAAKITGPGATHFKAYTQMADDYNCGDQAHVMAGAGFGPFQLMGNRREGGVMLGMLQTGWRDLKLDGARVRSAHDGCFIIAFNRDSAGQVILSALDESGARITQDLTIGRGQWKVEHVNVAKRSGGASKKWLVRRKGEIEQIVTARRQDHNIYGWRQKFIWPVKGRISGRFGSQRIYKGEPGGYHSGVDIARPTGTVFYAPADGVVTLVAKRPFSLEGNLIMLDHGMGLNSAFLHNSLALVEEGQVVAQGEPIGKIGATGRTTGAHLHWSMKWGQARIDPEMLAGAMH